jgi:hypothetical protein
VEDKKKTLGRILLGSDKEISFFLSCSSHTPCLVPELKEIKGKMEQSDT